MIHSTMREEVEGRIQKINEMGGPDEHIWPVLNRLLATIWELSDTDSDRKWVKALFSFVTDHPYPSCFKRILTQPEGYPGDYLTLFKLHHKSNIPPFLEDQELLPPSFTRKTIENWDNYLFNQHSAGILPHRSLEVSKLIRKELWVSEEYQWNDVTRIGVPGTIVLKDIACGWGLVPDALLLHSVPTDHIDYIGIDSSQKALDFTKHLVARSSLGFKSTTYKCVRISGIIGNLAESDITWSSGLFDYFTDDLFIRAAVNLLRTTRHVLAIGNMSPNCCSLPIGEVLNWTIQARTSERLQNLGRLVLNEYFKAKGHTQTMKSLDRHMMLTQDPTGAQFYLYLSPLLGYFEE